ncbi:MAG: type II toxin-antitoxin system RelE/ParE family toxin [Bacteroidota bacterium]
MSFKIEATPNFLSEAKKLSKKYISIRADLEVLTQRLSANPTFGTSLGGNLYKVRMAITSKGKGKSGGARVITYVKIIRSTVYLVSIYDKSEQETISNKMIRELVRSIP